MEKNIMPNVEVQNPRLPKFGQAVGPAGGISSDVFEMYAPQMAMTDFQTDFSKTGYEMSRDIEFERQAQLDAQIAQSKHAQEERQRGADRQAEAAKKGKKISSAATGATIGAKIGSAVPGVGTLIGGAIGGLGGFLFGEEGGMVPGIHPRSMLFKEYQQGGDVMGYTGQGNFLQRGLQNLQFRQGDLSRLTENVDKMGKYGFWDAAMDVGRGYMAGKALAPKAETLLSLAKSSYGVAKEKGIGAVWDVLSGKTTGLPEPVKIGNIEAPSSLELPQPTIGDSRGRLSIGQKDLDKFIAWKDKRADIEKGDLYGKLFPAQANQSPVRKTALTDRSASKVSKSYNKPKRSMVTDMLISGQIGHFNPNKIIG
jgi:hypothetical protein